MTSPTVRILIVDDHPVVRLGLSRLLSDEDDFEICGEAASGRETLQAVEELRPDLVLVDISLKDFNGLELIKQLRARYPSLRMLVSSMHDEFLFAERALHAGASGYVNKVQAIDNIVSAVRQVLAGNVYVSPRMTQRILKSARRGAADLQSAVAELSDRELEIFSLLGEGRTTREIASRLNLSIKTVESHRENIKHKLSLHNNNELIKRAVEWTVRQV